MKATFLALTLLATISAASAQTKPPALATTSQTTAAGPAGVAARMQTLGYKDIHDMRRGPDGQWTAKATRNGVPVTVTAEPQGSVVGR
ncbi:MAG: hypothetical protein ACHQK9_14260 [Reyranellales bacterium]